MDIEAYFDTQFNEDGSLVVLLYVTIDAICTLLKQNADVIELFLKSDAMVYTVLVTILVICVVLIWMVL